MIRTRSHILTLIFRYLKNRATFDATGIDQYRAVLEKNAGVLNLDSRVWAEKFSIKHIDACWFYPKNTQPDRIIMLTHGGGYIAGSIKSHTDLASRICRHTQSKVLLFNYRLAPEHPFPKGLDDVKTVYDWISKNHGHTHKICLAGDSAGGGLTLALLAGLLKNKAPLPACSVLISPWIDLECKNASHETHREKDPMFNPDDLKLVARLYTDKPLSDPFVSPINNNFKGLSPTLIQAGDNEVLRDDSKLLAEKLKTAGVDVQLEIWDHMFHVWHYFARYIPEGKEAIIQLSEFIKQH